MFSLPLDDTSATPIGQRAAKIESFTATTITRSAGGWTGNLASPAAPWAVRLTSGAAAGKLYDISANTATTLTLSGATLTTLGVATGDSFELVALDNLPCGCVAAAYRARPWDLAVVSIEAKGPHCPNYVHLQGRVLELGAVADLLADGDEE